MTNLAGFMETRSKVIQLFLIVFVNFDVGAILSVIGTTFPDLQCCFHVGLDSISSLFLSLGLGTGISSILFAFLVKKCHMYLLMAIMMLLFSLAVAMVAVMPYIAVAHVMIFVTGFAVGVLVPGSFLLCNWLFPEKTYPFHIASSAVSAGSFLSPLLAKPFLGNPIHNMTTFPNTSVTGNTSVPPYLELGLSGNLGKHSENTVSYCNSVSSAVPYLYVMIGTSGLPLTIALGWYFLRTRSDVNTTPHTIDTCSDSYSRRSVWQWAYTTLLIFTFAPAYGLAYTYGSYLTTTGVEGPLHLGIQRMALLTSVFWLLFLLGRITFTVVSIFVKQIIVLYCCMVGEVVAGVMLGATGDTEVMIWVGSLFLGFFAGPIYAALLVWSRDYVTLTPLIMGMCSFSDIVGSSLLPYISGELIILYGLQSHVYYCIALTLLQLAFLCLLHCLGSVIKLLSEVRQHEFMNTEKCSITSGTDNQSYH